MGKGLLIIISAPAGCGKDTIVEKLFKLNNNLKYSVSATTRDIREGEVEGKHYFFKTRGEFEVLIKNGTLLEYTEYCGNYYGTPKAAIEDALEDGSDIVLKIEIEGANYVKKLFPESVMIFIMPPSLSELRRRLEKRGTEDSATIDRRIEIARAEIANCHGYNHYIINDDLDKAVDDIIDIIDDEKAKNLPS